MTTKDWLDEPEEEEVRRQGERAAGGVGIKNLFPRNKIGDIDRPIVFWPVTAQVGERYKHWFALPNGKFTARNCAAHPNEMENALQLCKIHQYVAAGGGSHPEKGKPKMSHEYIMIGYLGVLEKVAVVDQNNDVIGQRDVVRWRHELHALECTPPMRRGFFKHYKNKEFPPGADGKITNYAFRVWTYDEEKGGQKVKRYGVEYYPGLKVGERPTHAFDPETNEKVQIDVEIGKMIYEQIVEDCKPSDNEALKAIFEAASGGVAPAGGRFDDDDEDDQAEGSTATDLSEQHGFADDDSPPTSAATPSAPTSTPAAPSSASTATPASPSSTSSPTTPTSPSAIPDDEDF